MASSTKLNMQPQTVVRGCKSEMDMSTINKDSRFSETFSTQFNENENFIKDFRCSIKDDIIILGKLYLTNEAIYFLPGLKVFKKKIRINYLKIHQITKTKSGIKVAYIDDFTIGTCLHMFSFLNRTKAFMYLTEAVEKYGNKESVIFCSGSDDNTSQNSVSTFKMTDKSCSNIRTIKSHGFGRDSLPCAGVFRSQARSTSLGNIIEDTTNNGCDYDGEKIIDERINFTPHELITFFMDPDCTFLNKCRSFQNTADYKLGECYDDSETGNKVRDLTYTILKAYMGKPVFVQGTITELVEESSSNHKDFLIETTSRGAPYADTIKLYHRYCVIKESHSSSILKIYLKVEFIKSVTKLFKGKIVKETQANAIEKINILMKFLRGETKTLTNVDELLLDSEIETGLLDEWATDENNADNGYFSNIINFISFLFLPFKLLSQCLENNFRLVSTILLFIIIVLQYVIFKQTSTLVNQIPK